MNSDFDLRLLVEGKDDYHVTIHLLNENRIGSFNVKECGGYGQVEEVFTAELKGSEAARVGIVVDADEYPDDRWASVHNLLPANGYDNLPTEMPTAGLVATGSEKPVGVWLMPDNRSMGSIEQFVEALIPEGNRLWDRAQDAICQIPVEERKFKPQAQPKAKIHTWLAWQEEPGTPMGAAITKRYLYPTSESAQAFVDWVKRLLAVEVDD